MYSIHFLVNNVIITVVVIINRNKSTSLLTYYIANNFHNTNTIYNRHSYKHKVNRSGHRFSQFRFGNKSIVNVMIFKYVTGTFRFSGQMQQTGRIVCRSSLCSYVSKPLQTSIAPVWS